MQMRTRSVALVVVALAVVLAGCSAGMQSGGDSANLSGETNYEGQSLTASADSEDMATSSDDGNYYQGEEIENNAMVLQRQRIMTGEVHLEVENFGEARSRVVSATRERGGFVSGSDVSLHRDGNRTWRTGKMVLRVPRGNFSSLMSAVESHGTVVSTSTDSKDVTDQLVDMEARLKNLRAQREKLRNLYDEANETEDVLEVQERLSEVQTEIERLEAKQRSLENRVAYSTVTVRIEEPRPGEPRVTEHVSWHETGVIAAFLQSIDGVVVVMRALVVGVAYALPYLAVFGIPLGGAALVLRRRGLP